MRALEAKGFTAGRQTDGTYRNQQSWVIFMKSDDPSFYKMPSDVGHRGGKSYEFFFDKQSKSPNWIPEATWKGLSTLDADRAALATKLAAAAQLFADTKSAPERCDDAVLAQDPALNTPVLGAKKQSFLLDTDLHGIAGWPAESRAYTTGAAPKPREKPSEPLESRMISDLVFDRSALDDLSKIRMLRVVRVTSYEAPRVTSKDTNKESPIDFFIGGRAAFDVGVVDLTERKVLCRGKGEAQSSKSIKEGQTADGDTSVVLKRISGVTSISQRGPLSGR